MKWNCVNCLQPMRSALLVPGEKVMTAELLGAGVVRELANKVGITPTKKLGQNFVIDPNTVRYIVEQANLTTSDVVLEVGPGLGSLTVGLLPQVERVIAVEIDTRLAAELPITVHRFAEQYEDRLTVVPADALRIQADVFAPYLPTAIVANLPYNVAVPVLIHLLEVLPSVRTVLVMVQKEVADRMCAGPGSRTYGIPSVKIRWFGHAEPAGNIGKNVFWPAPHVDSGLVRVSIDSPSRADNSVEERERVFAVVDACFAHRRKTLRAGLADFIGSPARAEEVLRAAGVDPSARAEQLELRDFIAVSDALQATRD